jgi:putative sugar O-methyltransferase
MKHLGASYPVEGPERLALMAREIANASPLYHPSVMWEQLNALNAEQVERLGLSHFKRSVNQNYFNWLPANLGDNQMRRVLGYWMQRPTLAPFRSRMEVPQHFEGYGRQRTLETWKARTLYRLFVALLWDQAMREDALGVLDGIQEPELGDPLRIHHRGRLISQDLANSAREANRLFPHLSPSSTNRPIIAELGAGYGRLGFVLVRALSTRYWVFDIPPALFIAEWYLQRVLPGLRIFTFRPFQDFEAVRAELEAADVAFFTANQIALLPDASVDAFVNISSLHEMRQPQIDHYLQHMARVTRHVIYLKQWTEFKNLADDVHITRESYRLPPEWRSVHDAADSVQDRFFELVARRA